MKIMIASDIHGSLYYLNELIKCYNKEKPEKLILLGDILYHGPRNDLPKDYNPKKVIEILNNMKSEILAVRGNCDTEVDQMVLNFPILADYAIMYHMGRMIFITHGHHYNTKNPPLINDKDILLHGHTHIPVCEDHGYIYMNPGSVSIPKENSEHSYMMLCDDTFYWKNLEGKVYMDYKIS